MASETKECVRELEVEVPAEAARKEAERVTRAFAREARLPGFRPGKAPPELIRRRFWDDIKSEVVRQLIPEYLETACKEKNLAPVGQPRILELDYEPEKPLRFRARIEILPEIKLGEYRGLEAEKVEIEITDEDVARELDELREHSATYDPVEGRPAADGDTAVASLIGVVTKPEEKREPIVLEDVLIQLGGEHTVEGFTAGLRGATAGEERHFDIQYPAEYPQANLAGRTVAFTARVKALKRKKLPALDDDFARSAGDFQTLDELKKKLREQLEQARDARQKELNRQRVLDALLARHDFAVPEALVAEQMDSRLERQARLLAAQGVDPRRVDIDWERAHRAGRAAAERDVRLSLLLERIAAAETIEATEAEVDQEVERAARQRQESPEAVRARLTAGDGLARMKAAIRSEKTAEFLTTHARWTAPRREEKS